MSKDKLTDYDSTTASNNTDVGGISVAEGMLPSAVNNSIRELTKQLGAFADGTDGIDVLSLADDDASHAIKLQAPSAVTADTTFTLPDGDGTADQVLKTDGSGQLGFADRHPNPSLIINGAMTVAQRGASGTLASTKNYLVDRFYASRLGGLADIFDTSQASDAPNGFSKSYKLTQDGTSVTLSGTNASGVAYIPEGQDYEHLQWGTSTAKSVTVSFYVKSSITGTFAFTIASSNSDQDIAKEYTINTASTWEKKVLTIPAPTSGTWGTGTSIFGSLVWGIAGVLGSTRETTNIDAWGSGSGGASVTVTANSTNAVATTSGATWQITGIKLEVGSTATDFEHRSYGDELLRCQRYCYRPFVSSASSVDAELGWPRFFASLYSGGGQVYITYPVSMRTDPVLTYSVQSGTIDTDQSSYVRATLRDSDDTAFYVFNFQADAEL